VPTGLSRPLAFAAQKLAEIVAVAEAVQGAAPGSIQPLDLAAFTGAPEGVQRELPAELIKRAEPYEQRR
jgi:hypothetical protein